MNAVIRLAVSCLLIVTSGACSFATFRPVDPNFRPKGKTLAVVAGLDDEPTAFVAQAMTDAFRKNTRFQVMPQKQVAQAVPGYPQTIKGPYSSAYFQIETDYAHTDVKKVRDIQQRLGVDYLYVMWAPTATVVQGKIQQLHIVAQLFEGPNSREVGNGMFAATAGRVGCCLAPTPGEKDRVQAVKDSTDYVAREIGEKTGMLK
jgi:hypothetical protein